MYSLDYLFIELDLQLHLNPVHAVVQLRPSMQYLSSKKNQAEATEESAGTSKRQVWTHGLKLFVPYATVYMILILSIIIL